MQLVFAQQLLDPVDLGGGRHAHPDPVGFAREFVGGDDLDRNPRDLFRTAQFGADLHFVHRFSQGLSDKNGPVGAGLPAKAAHST
ncbi:hypothetical protein D3C76_1735870 [compost metagenome]